MRNYNVLWLPMGVICFMLWFTVVFAQDTDWERAMSEGMVAYQQGRYAEAERLFKAALEEAEKFESQDPRLAESLSALAELYSTQSQYAQAEPLYRRALAI